MNITFSGKTERTDKNKKKVVEYKNYAKVRQCTVDDFGEMGQADDFIQRT